MKSKTKNLMTLLAIGLIFSLILSSSFSSTDIHEADVPIPKQSGGYTEPFIHIDASNPNNWTWTASNYSWCYFENGYFIIENVTIDASSSPTGSGIYIENSTNDHFIIRNCTTYNADNSFFDSGIWLENTSKGTLIYNNCSNNRQGIYLSNCSANTITENTVNNNEINGIYLETNCDHNNITRNTADNNLFGIQITTDCDYNNIALNTANENDDYGIYINSFGTSCDNNVILNNSANKNNRYGIYLRYSNNENSIINNSVNDNIGIGIYVVNSHILNVTGNAIYNNKRGLEITSCDTGYIRGNTISSNHEVGIYLYNADSNEIKNNIVNGNDLGIRLDNSDYNNITGNTLHDNSWCIYETYSVGNIIEDNDCSSPTTDLPIYIDDFATGVGAHNWTWAENQPWCSGTGTSLDPYIIENLSISGFGTERYGIDIRNSNVPFIIQDCQIDNSHDAGIYLDNVNNSHLINNNCSNNDCGIYVEYSNYITIFENSVNDNINEGIYVFEANYINISRNTANGNSDGIYLDESDFNSIIGNLACNNTFSGIRLTSDSDNNTISGNIIYSNTVYGLYLDECENNTISGNIANSNGFVGIHLNTQCRYNLILGNTANENTDSGIYFDGNDDHNTISGNTLRNNDYGMFITSDCNNNSIFNNFFLENGYHAVDDGTDNKWNSTLIGNYWDNHTTPDVSPQDGVVDTPYTFIGGSTGSIDYLPIAEDGAPRIIIHTPTTTSDFGIAAPSYNIEVIDSTPVGIWYSFDGGLTNITITEFSGTLDQSAWNTLPDGSVTITFYAVDMAGNIGTAEITIGKNLPNEFDPTLVIVIVSVIGGVFLLVAVLVLLDKKGKISLDKLKEFLPKRK